MLGFPRGRRTDLIGEIEGLLEDDLDEAAARLSAVRDRLPRGAAERLTGLVRSRLEGREHDTYLARALAEGTIAPTAVLELLETYEQAGYVTPEQASRHRRHAFEADRREMMELLAREEPDRFDYWRGVDGVGGGSRNSGGRSGVDRTTELPRESVAESPTPPL